MTDADRQAELEGWIRKTRRLQRRMAVLYAVLSAPALAVSLWSGTIAGFALLTIALVAICSFWVTAAHNAAHRQKLGELQRLAASGGKPPTTGHRRWQS
jgi:hypothetical protein